jgi:lipoprotein-anchoring transpeptidase ErfK/SrfK
MLLCVILCAGAAITARGQDTAAAGRGVAQSSAEAKPTYRTRAQEKIKDLVAAGETDIDELVKVIASDDREALDHVVINIATQRLYECNLEGQVLAEHKVSSGRVGFDTPPGEYHIVNKAPKAYSKKYSAWMLYWMGLTSNGDYGMHGLEGSSYERLLGSVASHGCVRLSREYAKALYPRVKVGMPVTIVKDAKLNLTAYEPLSKQAAISLVLDAISPADPWEAYY